MYEKEKRKLKTYLGDNLYDALKAYNCIVAGGMITSIFCDRKINDVDVYFHNKEDLANFIKNESIYIVALTKKAIKIGYCGKDVHLIHFDTFEKIGDLFNTFDFTLCMGAYDFKEEQFVLHDDFLLHNLKKKIVVNPNTVFPISSLIRVNKYIEKGYSIDKNELVKITLCCLDLNIDNYDDLKEQIGGMYGLDFGKIIDDLKGDPFDLKRVIEKINDSETYCGEEDTNTPFDVFSEPDWDFLASAVSGENPQCIKVGNNIYSVPDFTNVTEYASALNVTYVDLDVYFKNKYLYKFVRMLDDGSLRSMRYSHFRYNIGEDAIAEINNEYGGIYCYDSMKKLLDSGYARHGKNNVAIKMEFSVDDIISLNPGGIVVCKKVKPVEVIYP